MYASRLRHAASTSHMCRSLTPILREERSVLRLRLVDNEQVGVVEPVKLLREPLLQLLH